MIEPTHARSTRRTGARIAAAGLLFVLLGGPFGCIPAPSTGEPNETGSGSTDVYNNTTDKTNNGAEYLGSAACSACHSDVAAEQLPHAHNWVLNPVQGRAPEFPAAAVNAGVPNPPDGYTWDDIAYVIGGYTRKALFIDTNGFVLTNGVAGVDTQWNLTLPANGTTASFAPFQTDSDTLLPYDISLFGRQTTGPMTQDMAQPEFQQNRPGIIGTWHEAGVRCEACHGPGSKHIPDPAARNIFVDQAGEQTCVPCHSNPFDTPSAEILAADGFIQSDAQHNELLASGGHAGFACTTCHDPHRSVKYDKSNALAKTCTDCHASQNMAHHEGKVFTRGDYTEVLTCESCHMPLATRDGSAAGTDVVGASGAMGDTRTHIFRINPASTDAADMFTADGTQVARDAQGRAAVTLNFVCLRCHTDNTAQSNTAFPLPASFAIDIATGIHE